MPLTGILFIILICLLFWIFISIIKRNKIYIIVSSVVTVLYVILAFTFLMMLIGSM